ncbi:uncharacterized protein LOC131439957 [Malaya genurostris]|uniref:uncharacterized protein LOC131439957 n=1 Tax=Malaya genurostris TaxID=325434 RepID=UPI0026F3F467|nr:uncharacterized protein LOC131439957 [Malaya genurostris]
MPTTIEDLPEEMLVEIFSYLKFEECLTATTVCRLWSRLALRWNELRVVLEFDKGTIYRALLDSSRPYRHFFLCCALSCDHCDEPKDEPAQILAKFSSTIETLEFSDPESLGDFAEFLAKLTTFCTNLKRLAIVWYGYGSPGFKYNFQPLNELSDLYLGLIDENLLEIDFRKVTPNITNLYLRIDLYSKLSQQILQHFSPRLKELTVGFHAADHLTTVYEMNFPLLKKLHFYGYGITLNHDWLLDLFTEFFRRCAKLESVTLQMNVNMQELKSIAQFCCNLQSLCFGIAELSEDCFRCLSEMRCLKCLRIEHTTIHAHDSKHSIRSFSKLQMLTLYCVRVENPTKFNTFLSTLCPALITLELLKIQFNTQTLEIYKAICFNLLIKRLTIKEDSMKVNELSHFASLPQLREMRLDFYIFYGDNEGPYGTSLDSIRILKLNADFNVTVLKLVPNLSQLYLKGPRSEETIQAVRKLLPHCAITFKKKLRIVESNDYFED